jgi:hypothetical protein
MEPVLCRTFWIIDLKSRRPCMMHLDFSEADIMAIKHERFNHPDPRVQRRMEVILLKAYGLPHHQIHEIAGVCGNTMRSHFMIYREGGIEKLKELNDYRPQSELANHRQTLEDYFRKHPIASISEAR